MDIAELLKDPATVVKLPGVQLVELCANLHRVTIERDTFKLTAESASQQVTTLTQKVADLQKALEEAKKPAPPPAPPPTQPPAARPLVISKTEVSGLAALTIEKSLKSPDDAMYTEVRNVLAWAADKGFNAWRGFFNADEVRQHLRLKENDPKHLPGFGRTLGLGFIADSIGTALKKLDPNSQREYLNGLEAMGALAVVLNDANDEETLDLVEWTQRVRTVLPKMPIMASLTGTAKIALYPMFDLFEAQTFGTREELSRFLERAFNVFCLDARKPISADEITTRAAIVLAAKPKAFFYYTEEAADWLTMPSNKAEAIKKMIDMWKTL